jgi:peptide/nickel transport system substrate-binding protein
VSDSFDFDRLRVDALAGRLNRRSVLKRGAMLGLSAPVIAGLLAACGSDDKKDADSGSTTTSGSGGATETGSTPETSTGAGTSTSEAGSSSPTASEGSGSSAGSGQAGGDGQLRLVWWQAPTILNGHLATGTKDSDASSVCYEPLANFNSKGEMVPILAAEIPTLDNGGVAEDGLSVTWKLRDGVKWHDGEAFSADDVVFTWEYAADEATTTVTQAIYAVADKVEALDPLTVKVSFKDPNPAWYDLFVGINGHILPKHVFADYTGDKSRDAKANLAPVGTGPFKVREFRPGDVVYYDRFEDYWDPSKPAFDSVEMKGGGDSAAAARAVLQTGEGDWAWNTQIEPQILKQMEGGGAGKVLAAPGTSAERLMINFADPNTEVDGARAEPSTKHPLFQHKEARNALALAIQRDVIAEQLYGPGGVATSNNLNAPPQFTSKNTTWEYDLDKAKELLKGVPEANGFSLLFQTSTNSVRQKTQEIIKQNLEQLGLKVELKSVESSVFFSSDAGNPDTNRKFYADLEMYTNGPSSPYPIAWAVRFRSDEICSKANNWAADNVTRYANPEYDALHDQAKTELNPEKQAELFIKMNDLSVNDFAEIPLIYRTNVVAVAADLEGYDPAPFMTDVYDIANWRRKKA